jgi:Phytanoyl-CoA dioxygenase (PhyH)
MSSEYRQLWPLLPGAGAKIERHLALGAITPEEAAALDHLGRHGHVVLPGAVEEALVDALVEDVARIAGHPGYFVTTDHRRGKLQRFSGPDFDSFESIYDTYVCFESARRVCFHPSMLRLIELAFETKVIAAQQLLFQRSNQHPVHQDTSVVCMEDPLLMLATWVALEDVVPGRGELTYYAGSHRIAGYPFADGSKRQTPADDADAVRAHLLRECARLGCEKKDFIAKKGDAFIWAADLVHGSNPRTRPEGETRRSVVTHFCPTTTRPFWFRFHPGKRGLASHRGIAEYASQFYQLPARSELPKPVYTLP